MLGKFLNVIRIIISAVVGLYIKFGGKEAKLERLRKKAQEYEDKYKEAIALGNMDDAARFERLWRRVSSEIANNCRS